MSVYPPPWTTTPQGAQNGHGAQTEDDGETPRSGQRHHGVEEVTSSLNADRMIDIRFERGCQMFDFKPSLARGLDHFDDVFQSSGSTL